MDPAAGATSVAAVFAIGNGAARRVSALGHVQNTYVIAGLYNASGQPIGAWRADIKCLLTRLVPGEDRLWFGAQTTIAADYVAFRYDDLTEPELKLPITHTSVGQAGSSNVFVAETSGGHSAFSIALNEMYGGMSSGPYARPTDDAVFFLRAVDEDIQGWVRDLPTGGVPAPLVTPPGQKVRLFGPDGAGELIWVQEPTDGIGPVTLWHSPVATTPAQLNPQLVGEVIDPTWTDVAYGPGHIAYGNKDDASIHVYRIADGQHRAAPLPNGDANVLQGIVYVDDDELWYETAHGLHRWNLNDVPLVN